MIIIRNWTRSQRTVFRTLRVLLTMKKSRLKSVALCSYFIKTLMLWACEEKSPDFWNEDRLVDSVRQLLNELIVWMTDRRCPNYFIPSNNMMDHLNDSDLSDSITGALQTVSLRDLICRVIYQCLDDELLFNNGVRQVELAKWINRSFIILNRTFNFYNEYTWICFLLSIL